MKVELKLGVTRSETTKKVDLSEYGMTKKEWLKMDESEKQDWLYENIIYQFDSPAWALESIQELN